MTTHYLRINSSGGVQPHAYRVGADYAITNCGDRTIGDVCLLAARTCILPRHYRQSLPVEIPYTDLGVGRIANRYPADWIDSKTA